MKNKNSDYIHRIRQTERCRLEVRKTAERMASLSADSCEELIKELMIGGEDKALGILLNVCAVNEIKLTPDLLAETLKVVEPLIDFGPLYRFQDKTAILPLLEVAQAEDISMERQVYASLIAAEMTVVHNSERQPVMRVLRKLQNSYLTLPLEFMLAGALELLEGRDDQTAFEEFVSQQDIFDILPAERPPVIIGNGQTVRRPIPKIGRNAPCHCGSGKKYKKCCFGKDQILLRDASPYEGVTMSQARTSPDMVDDAEVIRRMRAYELKKLNPSRLSADQLYAAYQRADLFGLRDLAFEMLLELERRPEKGDFDPGHFEDLLHSALDAGNVEVAEKILRHIPPDQLPEPDLTMLNLHLIKHREHFDQLETLFRRELLDAKDPMPDPPLLRLSYGLEKTYPALSIVFARASISGNPDRFLDNDTLLDSIRRARAEIGIEPWNDPIEDYVEWSFYKGEQDFERDRKTAEIRNLTEKVAEVRKIAGEKEKELQQKENQLSELILKLEKETASSLKADSMESRKPAASSPEEKDTISKLRRRVEELKAEINTQQQTRRTLREQLRNEREKARKLKETKDVLSKQKEPEPSLEPPKNFKQVLIPEYTPTFRRACESIPPPVVAKSVKFAAGFAARDDLIWRQTKQIKRIPECYGIRIGMGYRLLLRWVPDETLEVLDLIPRAELETWIRQNAG